MAALSFDFAMSWSRNGARALILILALLFGLLAGYVDIHNAEVQAAALIIVCAAGMLGIAAPRLALFSGVLVGLGVPIVHAIARAAEYPLPFAMNNYWQSFIAVVPALIAAAIGALLRRGVDLR